MPEANERMRLDRWISPEVRELFEGHFYARINQQARFDILCQDEQFMAELNKHASLFADHGVVHVRDVAAQVLEVLDILHGSLIPRRSSARFTLMQGYGVLAAYCHDVGMVDMSAFGRRMHPVFAAQMVFDPAHDDIVEAIWHQNSGNLAWYLSQLAANDDLQQEPKLILREMLAMSMCHSKRSVPVAVLNDPARLRQTMLSAVGNDIEAQYRADLAEQEVQQFEQINPHPRRLYGDYEQEAFAWLLDDRPHLRALQGDVIDALRALRCADALRQRGAVLKTSGGYEIFVDQRSANAVFALRLGEDRLYLLEVPGPVSAGEANIASSELEQAGALRLSFHRGAFADESAVEHAAYSAAVVVLDIQADVIDSLVRPSAEPQPPPQRAGEMEILLEETTDNHLFADMVRQQIIALDQDVGSKVSVVPSLTTASARERERYLAADALSWDLETRRQILARVRASGHATAAIDPSVAFNHVRLITLRRGDVLIDAGASSGFVYIPLGDGLEVIPLGGYQTFTVQPWMPLGLTGVIRGAARNADVVADRSVRLLMMPKSVYLHHWHFTHDPDSFRRAVDEALAERGRRLLRLSNVEKAALLEKVSLFEGLSHDTLLRLAAECEERSLAANSLIVEKGEMGDSLYIIAEGSVRVHDGGRLIDTLGRQEVFGEMAALSPEPRMASVTALSDVQLLELSSATMQKLFGEYGEVASGVLRVLTRRLRARVQDIARLNEELRSLNAGD